MNKQEKEIRQKLYEVRQRSADSYLRFMGFDVKKFRDLERDIDGGYYGLIENLQKIRLKDGEERAKNHQGILELRKKALKTKQWDLLTRAEGIVPGTLVPLNCGCDYTDDVTENKGNSKNDENEINIDPPLDPPPPIWTPDPMPTVLYDSNLNQAKPYADIKGGGDPPKTIQINAFYKFVLKPTSNGRYCILPSVLMNGWWLLWTWGSGCGVPGTPGSGEIHIKLIVRVEQISAEVENGRIERTILHKISSGGSDAEGPIDYASDTDGGARIVVYLEGGNDAVVFVECEVYTHISNNGRAIVDMQRGRFSYFRVPSVLWGKYDPCPPPCYHEPLPCLLEHCMLGPCSIQPQIICPPKPDFEFCPPSPGDIICPPAPGTGGCVLEPGGCLPGPDPVPDLPVVKIRNTAKRRNR